MFNFVYERVRINGTECDILNILKCIWGSEILANKMVHIPC